jgi:hypothetical protein
VFAGPTVSGISTGSFNWSASRANTSSEATYQYKTGATLNWYHGTRGLANNNWYLFNNNLSTNTLILDYATDAATFAGAVTIAGGSNTASAGAVNLTSSSYGGGYTLKDGTKYLGIFSKSSGTQLCFYTNQAAGTDLGSLTPDLIINTGTSTFAGKVTVSNTTAGSAGAGALVVSGGLATGAASYFGGEVTASTSGNTALSVFSTDAATGNPFVRVGYNSNLSGQLSNDAATGKTYLDSRYNDVTSAVIIRTKASGTPVVNATFDSTGAATFAGAVAIGNTTAAAVAAPSTHKVSILIGGVQYYLLASNV